MSRATALWPTWVPVWGAWTPAGRSESWVKRRTPKGLYCNGFYGWKGSNPLKLMVFLLEQLKVLNSLAEDLSEQSKPSMGRCFLLRTPSITQALKEENNPSVENSRFKEALLVAAKDLWVARFELAGHPMAVGQTLRYFSLDDYHSIFCLFERLRSSPKTRVLTRVPTSLFSIFIPFSIQHLAGPCSTSWRSSATLWEAMPIIGCPRAASWTRCPPIDSHKVGKHYGVFEWLKESVWPNQGI